VCVPRLAVRLEVIEAVVERYVPLRRIASVRIGVVAAEIPLQVGFEIYCHLNALRRKLRFKGTENKDNIETRTVVKTKLCDKIM